MSEPRSVEPGFIRVAFAYDADQDLDWAPIFRAAAAWIEQHLAKAEDAYLCQVAIDRWDDGVELALYISDLGQQISAAEADAAP